MEIPRLNGVIKALEEGQTAFVTFLTPDVSNAVAANDAPYDGVIFEMEHTPYDPRLLRDCMQYMLTRRQIAQSASVAPKVTPFVRIPANGGEHNQWLAKQALDLGVYGIVWPHVSTVEDARSAVASCRYPRPASAPLYEPAGQRGDSPTWASRYWGLTPQEYYARADVWPLDPRGEILVVIMIEDAKGVENIGQILDEVPGIGVVLIGEGDLSQDLGLPRQYDHPEVVGAIDRVLAACKERNVVCGLPHVNAANVRRRVEQGFRWIMIRPVVSFSGLEQGREATGRT